MRWQSRHLRRQIFLGAFIFGQMGSGSAFALSLMQAYEYAVLTDPAFQSATRDYEAGMANLPIGRAALLPKLSANYAKSSNQTTISGQQQINGVAIGPYQYNSNYPSDSGAIQLTQPIFSLDALARFRQGKAQSDFSVNKYQYLTEDLASRVLIAYTDLLYSIDNMQYQNTEFRAFEEQALVSARLFQKGEAPETDMLQAQSSAMIAKAKLVESKNDVEQARLKLEGMIGQIVNLNQLSTIDKNFSFLKLDLNSFDLWRERALEKNSELMAMKSQVEIANQEYKKNTAAHYPVLNFVAAATTQTSNTTVTINQKANQSYAGVQLNLPLYTGGEIQARSNQAYANYQKAMADYEVARNRVLTDLRKQFDSVQSGKEKITALTASYDAAQKLVRAMQKSVRSGEKINLDILAADRTLYLASRDLAQAKYQYLTSYLKLNLAGGEYDLDDFKKITFYFK